MEVQVLSRTPWGGKRVQPLTRVNTQVRGFLQLLARLATCLFRPRFYLICTPELPNAEMADMTREIWALGKSVHPLTGNLEQFSDRVASYEFRFPHILTVPERTNDSFTLRNYLLGYESTWLSQLDTALHPTLLGLSAPACTKSKRSSESNPGFVGIATVYSTTRSLVDRVVQQRHNGFELQSSRLKAPENLSGSDSRFVRDRQP